MRSQSQVLLLFGLAACAARSEEAKENTRVATDTLVETKQVVDTMVVKRETRVAADTTIAADTNIVADTTLWLTPRSRPILPGSATRA
jgi:hypothetical protein